MSGEPSASELLEDAQQEMARAWSVTLSRNNPTNPLTSQNSTIWIGEMRSTIDGLFIQRFLTSDEDAANCHPSTKNMNKVIRMQMARWIIKNMDVDNANRFRAKIVDQTSDEGPILQALPSKLWKSIIAYYINKSKTQRLLTRNKLDAVFQGARTDLRSYLDIYQNAVNNFKDVGGTIDDIELGSKFIASLHSSRFSDCKTIMEKDIDDYESIVLEIKKIIDQEDLIRKPNNNQNHPTVTTSSEAQAISRQQKKTCSVNKCIGSTLKRPHTESDCFKKSGNEHKFQEWMEEKKKSGVWRSEVSGNAAEVSSSSISSSHSLVEPSIEQLEASFNGMSLEEVSSSCVTSSSQINPIAPVQIASSPKITTGYLQIVFAIVDTGSTDHMFRERDAFTTYTDETHLHQTLSLAGGSATLNIHGRGSVSIIGEDGHSLLLHDCIHVPDLNRTLLGGTILIKLGYVTFPHNEDEFEIRRGVQILFRGPLPANARLLHVKVRVEKSTTTNPSCKLVHTNDILLLHRRLGHPNFRSLKTMVNKGSVLGLEKMNDLGSTDDLVCNTCDKAKAHKLPHNFVRNPSSKVLENVHIDLSGIIRTAAVCGSLYYVLFTDDYTRFKHINPMKSKSADTVFEKVSQYTALVERQCEAKIKNMTLDNGTEFINDTMVPDCLKKGIYLRTTSTYTPEENGVAERGNRTVMEKARAILLEANLPIKFWSYIVVAAVYLINRTITSSLPSGITPYEAWYHRKPHLGHIRTIGCLCNVLIRKAIRGGKFSQVSRPGVLLGHTEHNLNYIVYLFDSNSVVISHNVTFDESNFPFRKVKSFDISHLTDLEKDPVVLVDPINPETPIEQAPVPLVAPDQENLIDYEPAEMQLIPVEDEEENEEFFEAEEFLPPPPQPPLPPQPVAPRRGDRVRNPPDRFIPGAYFPKANLAFWDDPDSFTNPITDIPYAFATGTTARLIDEPNSYTQAMNSKHCQEWKDACDVEMKNMKDRGVWSLVKRPTDKPVVGSRWHFKVKPNPDGSINKFKSRFVAKGYTQTFGVDYNATYAPTGKPASYRSLVAFAARMGYEVHSMDAIAAFLNSKLNEEVYLEQPEGYRVGTKKQDLVAKANQALYGLKQSANEWNEEFKGKCIEAGFTQSPSDECIYIRIKDDNHICLFYLHVDDLAITGNDIIAFKKEISGFWPMEDLGISTCVVGIQTLRISTHHYVIGQEAMSRSLVARFGLTDCKPTSTPLPGGHKLTRSSPEEAAKFAALNLPYRSGVGSLMYLSQCTRPDISYAVGVLSQHLETPSQRHWDALNHVIKYIKGTVTAVINYKKGEDLGVTGNQSYSLPDVFADADWAGDKSTRRSTTGYVFKVLGGAVCWRSRLQQTVALSSTEAEYRATTEAGQEAIWLARLLTSFGIPQKKPQILNTDSLSAMDLSENAVFHGRTKHIEIHHHWIREQVGLGSIKLKHCSSEDMVADMLTKPLHPGPFHFFRKGLGITML